MKKHIASGLLVTALVTALLTACGADNQKGSADTTRISEQVKTALKKAESVLRNVGSAAVSYFETQQAVWKLGRAINDAESENTLSDKQVRSLRHSINFIEGESQKLLNMRGSDVKAQRKRIDNDIARVNSRLKQWTASR